MKKIFLFLLTFISVVLYSQADAPEISMAATTARYVDGQWTYFEKGEASPFTGVLFAKYDNGNWKSRQDYIDGVGNGTWINYYENGQVKERGTYINNRVEGTIKKYYPNGQLKAEGQYREWRIRVGVWNYYDEGGALVEKVDHGSKGDYRDVQYYYENGSISKSRYQYLMKH